MKVGITDLRYHMKEVLEALDRNEPVTVLYHGKEKAVITPIASDAPNDLEAHPFFGMHGDDARPIKTVMKQLRGGRY